MLSESGSSMDGRVCVVTGATSGIGEATATALAQRGATVVVLGRDSASADAAASRIRTATGNPNVEPLAADLASIAAVRAAAQEIAVRHPRLSVLVNNAGVSLGRRTVTRDGLETTFAVNHLAHFLLTQLLLPQLRAGAPSRLITVTSRFERWGHIHFDDLQLERGYTRFRAYAQSKLANVLFTYELAERNAGSGVTANCYHPGLVATNLLRDMPRWLEGLWRPFLLTPARAARTGIYLATSPEPAAATGGYYERERRTRSSRVSYDPIARGRLWQVSDALVGNR